MARLLVCLGISLCFACAGNKSSSAAPASAQPAAAAHHAEALAQIEGRSGSKLVGSARFESAEGGVTAHIVIANAEPGEHGIHIHETGDCSAANASSAGGHYNPEGSLHHGGIIGAERHGGDLGNITADANGNGSVDVTVPGISIKGASNGIIGRAIVVHEKTDDLHSDPSGNSGARIGCGVITAAP